MPMRGNLPGEFIAARHPNISATGAWISRCITKSTTSSAAIIAPWPNGPTTICFLPCVTLLATGCRRLCSLGRINSFVEHAVSAARHPCQVVDTLNQFGVDNFSGLGIYVTFLCVEVDLRRRSIAYAGAGHPPALLQRRNGTIESLGSLSPLIGIFPEMGRGCQVSKTFFMPGDRLLLFTDGFSETRNSTGDTLGVIGMSGILRNLGDKLDSAAILAEFVAARRQFAGHEVPDDVLLMAARFCPT